MVQGSNTRTVGYQYDGLGRLALATAVAGATTTTYGYTHDLAGNRISASVNGVPTQTRAYDAADQVTSAGYSYDGAGNLLADGSQTYTYDPLGRLASATTGGATTGYAYNGDNVLASKTAGGATTRYTLDTQGGLSERLGQTASGAATWYVRGWGAELARGISGGTTWYLADRLGSVRGEYGTTASVTGKTNYDPFGQPEVGAGLGVPTDYGFTGEPQGDGAGLLQLRARWYQPGGGQFVSRDPFAGDAGTPQSYNAYAYAHDDPANRTDPTGLSPLREPSAGGGSDVRGRIDRALGGGAGGALSCLGQETSLLVLGVTAGELIPVVEAVAAHALELGGKAVVLVAETEGAALTVPVLVTVGAAALLVLLVVGEVALLGYAATHPQTYPAPATDAQGRPIVAPGPALPARRHRATQLQRKACDRATRGRYSPSLSRYQ